MHSVAIVRQDRSGDDCQADVGRVCAMACQWGLGLTDQGVHCTNNPSVLLVDLIAEEPDLILGPSVARVGAG